MSASTFSVSYAEALPSTANLREHHMSRANRAKCQRKTAATECARAKRVPMPLTVMLTRLGKQRLDDDNLAHAFKAVRDGVADALGIKDNDPRVQWLYAQEKRPPGHPMNRVRIAS